MLPVELWTLVLLQPTNSLSSCHPIDYLNVLFLIVCTVADKLVFASPCGIRKRLNTVNFHCNCLNVNEPSWTVLNVMTRV